MGAGRGDRSPDRKLPDRVADWTKDRVSRAEAWIDRQPKNLLTGATAALVLIVLVVMVVALAGGGPDEPGALAAAATTTEPDETAPTTGESAAQAEDTPEGRFAAAVERSQQAESYRFEGRLALTSGGGRGEVLLAGWVDGADRELVVRSGEDPASITRVIDGVATFDDGTGPEEIPLEEAGPAPGFDLLQHVELTRVADGQAEGTLSADALASFQVGGEVPAEGSIVVTFAEFIDGYTMRDPNGAWAIEVAFTDYGVDVGT